MRVIAIALVSLLCVASIAAKVDKTATLGAKERLDKVITFKM